MAVTYNLTTLIGQVRLKISDKIILSPVFQDEELQVFLDANLNNVNLASADALEAWAANYGASVDSERAGDYSYSQNIVRKMMDLAKSLREKEGVSGPVPAGTWSEMNLTGTEEEDVV